MCSLRHCPLLPPPHTTPQGELDEAYDVLVNKTTERKAGRWQQPFLRTALAGVVRHRQWWVGGLVVGVSLGPYVLGAACVAGPRPNIRCMLCAVCTSSMGYTEPWDAIIGSMFRVADVMLSGGAGLPAVYRLCCYSRAWALGGWAAWPPKTSVVLDMLCFAMLCCAVQAAPAARGGCQAQAAAGGDGPSDVWCQAQGGGLSGGHPNGCGWTIWVRGP